MDLSIIVCVYKVEKYIEKCINSLLYQDLSIHDYEIIIINDGSPDNSHNIIKKFLKNNHNIIYIEQKNQGLAKSRNLGIEISKGDYIIFVDPDDYIQKDSLKKILNKTIELDCDILYLQIAVVDENYNKINDYPACGKDAVVLNGIVHPRRPFPATLYSRDAISNIRHIPEIKRAQDSVFNAMVQSKCKKVSYYSLPYYNYLVRADSCKINDHTEPVFESSMLSIATLNNFLICNFSAPSKSEEAFFNNVIKIFIERAFQWSIIPDLDRKRFIKIKKLLAELHLTCLLDELATEYKFVNKSYISFYCFNKAYRLKNNLNILWR